MFPYIENYENPQIGEYFLVRSVIFNRNGNILEWPVVDDEHIDGSDYGQPKPHYHVDWRFMNQNIIDEHRSFYKNRYPNGFNGAEKTEYFSPIMSDEVIEKKYTKYKYLRDHDFPSNNFKPLSELLKDAKMKRMKCPHH